MSAHISMSSTSKPGFDSAAPLIFLINAASGSSDGDAKRAVLEEGLQAAGRPGELRFAKPGELPRVAQQAAAEALTTRSAVVAVGGDGTINAVAQAAHAAGCPLGVVPLGTFNYFARTHGIATEPAAAVQQLLQAAPVPVQVGEVNGQLFLVNASLGLYPDLLEDRETYKSRFGRSRLVALGAACMTLLRAHRQLRLQIEEGGVMRKVRTPTLFVGNNRLQLKQVGLHLSTNPTRSLDDGRIAAVMLKSIGSLSMAWLMLRGAVGTLGDADSVESFAFQCMRVSPRLAYGRRQIKVAFDGEVTRMRSPLEFRVAAQPLYLLKPLPSTQVTPA